MLRRPETQNEIWCGGCRTMHPKSSFGKYASSPSGLNYVCSDVVSARNRTAHRKNQDQNNARHAATRVRRKMSTDRIAWAIKKLLADARRRAGKKGLEFSLSPTDLSTPEKCPVFGCDLVYQADAKRRDESASLDRIDATRGYVPGNVWIVSWRANQIKSNATAAELRAVADAIDGLGKARAGRILDGREHSEFPEARS